MATGGAKLGTRTRFLREDPVGSGTYVAVAEVKSIGGSSISRGAVEVSHIAPPGHVAIAQWPLGRGGALAESNLLPP